MDDMTAFERQVAGEFVRRAGPVRPVDAAAILTAVTAAHRPGWRFQPMVGAARFVVAGAIVALFGGLLLAGLPSQPSDPTAPAAVTASPSPTTTQELLSGMVTEEVERGVLRIVNDGIRDISPAGDREERQLSIGADGSIWLLTSAGVGTGQTGTLVRLGDPEPYPVVGIPNAWSGLQVAADGSPVVLDGARLKRLEEDGWVAIEGPTGGRYDIAPDGTIWQAVPTDIVEGTPVAIAQRWTGSGWEVPPFDVDLAAALGVDPDVIAGHQVKGFRAAPDGSVWVGLAVPYRDAPPNGDGFGHLLLRFDGERWSVIDPMGIRSYFDMDHFDIGADGTAWVYLDTHDDDPHLARLSGGVWSVYSSGDGVTPIGVRGEAQGYLEVAPDGTAWMHQMRDDTGRCPGVRSFDGTTWQRYLDGTCVADLDIAPDGTVWVTGASDAYPVAPWPKAGDTYRIEPAP